MNVNKVIIVGRATRDPESRTTTNGSKVVNLGMATGREWKDKNGEKHSETEFHNLVFWGSLATVVSDYVRKGSLLYVEGRLQTQSWADKNSGEKKYRTEIVGERIQLGPKSSNPVNKEESQEFKPVASPGGIAIHSDDLPPIPEEDPNLGDFPA